MVKTKVDLQEFPNLIGEKVIFISNGVEYKGTVRWVNDTFVHINVSITDIPHLVRLDRRIMAPERNFLYKIS